MRQLEDFLVQFLLVGAHAQATLLLLNLPSEEGSVVVELLFECVLLRLFLMLEFLSILSPQLSLLSEHVFVNLFSELSLLNLLLEHLTHLCLTLGLSLLTALVFEHVIHLLLLDIVIELLLFFVTLLLLFHDHIISHSIHVLLHFGSSLIELIDFVLFLLIKDFEVCFLSFNICEAFFLCPLILLSLSQFILSEDLVHEVSLILFLLEVVLSLLFNLSLQFGHLLCL